MCVKRRQKRVNDAAAGISKSGGVRRVSGLMELSLTEDRDAESLLLYRFLIKNLTFHTSFQSDKGIYFWNQTVHLRAPLLNTLEKMQMNC